MQYISMKRIISIKLNRLLFIFSIIVFFAQSAFGQSPARFDHIDSKDIQYPGYVRSMVQDNDGFMWFSTQDGLYRYNGYSFTSFKADTNDPDSLSDNELKDLHIDRKGIIWIASSGGGIDRLDPRTEKFRQVFPKHGSVYEHNKDITAMKIDSDDNLWFISGGNLFKLNTLNERLEPIEYTYNDISKDKQYLVHMLHITGDYIWVRLNMGGLLCLDRHTLKIVQPMTDAAIQAGFHLKMVPCMYIDSRGTIWASKNGGGVYTYNWQENKFKLFTVLYEESNIIQANNVRMILEDRRGNIWFSTANVGLIKYNRADNTFQQFLHDPTDTNSLSFNMTNMIFEDKSGCLWISTSGKGLNRYSIYNNKFTRYSFKNQINQIVEEDFVNAVLEDSKAVVWIGTSNNGLAFFDRIGKKVKRINLLEPPINSASNKVLSIMEDSKGRILVGADGDLLLIFDRDTRKFLKSKKISTINTMMEDSHGRIIVGTVREGLALLNSKLDLVFFKELRGFHDENNSWIKVNSILESSQGNFWIGTDQQGLYKMDESGKIQERYLYDPNNENGISSSRILSIYEDQDGILWLGTRNGLNRFDVKKKTFKRYSTEDGFSNNIIYSVMPESDKTLWMSTNNGLIRFNHQTYEVRNFGMEDGLPNNEFNTGSYYKSKKGELFFGGVSGIVSIFPKHLVINQHRPAIALTSFKIFEKEVSFDKPINQVSQIQLEYNQNFFSFEFAALDYNNPARNKYAYKLEGMEENWNYSGVRRFANYTHVPPGNYVFRIRASNNDSIWNNTGKSIVIKIAPPFWLTWEFRIGLILAGLSLIVVAHRFRTKSIRNKRDLLQKEVDERRAVEHKLRINQKRLRRLTSEMILVEERERSRLARALHDRIGHSLFSAQFSLAAVLKELRDSRQKDMTRDILKTIKETIREARSLTVEISPPSLRQFGLEDATESLLERFSANYGIKTIFNTECPDNLKKDMAILLYQAIRELLMNVIKHSGSKSVVVTLSKDSDNLIVSVKDFGKGFDKEDSELHEGDLNGYGLFSIGERMQSIGGSININSTYNHGAEVIISVPLNICIMEKQDGEESVSGG